jgi:DNA-directed RNA polymerase delta subunit
MRHDKFTEFGRYNSQIRKSISYNYADLLFTVRNLSIEDLIWYLKYIISFNEIPEMQPDPIEPFYEEFHEAEPQTDDDDA